MKKTSQEQLKDPGAAQMVGVADLVPDAGNVRSLAPKGNAADADLVASVKAQGILQPLLVRFIAKGKPFVVVAGHRRLAAAKAAGLDKVPCLVQTMTDDEAREKQLIENLQREDLAPMDEARAYKDLVDKHGYDVRAVAAKIGKGVGYVYARFRLLGLSKKWQAWLTGGGVAAVAEVVASHVDDQALQDRIFDEHQWDLRRNDVDAAQMRDLINRRYMLDLKKAPWNLADAGLVPGCVACSSCPQRTQAQMDLLGSSSKDNFCLNSSCWTKKKAAHTAQLVAKNKAAGKDVAEGAQAASVLKDADTEKGKWALLDSSPRWYHRGGSLREALRGKKVPVAMLVVKEGQLQEVVERKALLAAMPKSSGDYGDTIGRTGPLSVAEKAKRKARLLDLKATDAAWPKAWAAAVAKLAGSKPATWHLRQLLQVLLTEHLDRHSTEKPAERLGLKLTNKYRGGGRELAAHLAKLKTDKDVLTLAWQVALGQGLWDTHLDSKGQLVFKLAGVDWAAMKAVEAKAITAARADKLAAKAPATKRHKITGGKPLPAKKGGKK